MFDPAADESFMVWMRTAAGSNSAKLAMRNDQDVMRRGMYRLDVVSRMSTSNSKAFKLDLIWLTKYSDFPAHLNKGTKSVIITTTSIMGRRNSFLGRGFAILGALCFLTAFLSALTLKYTQRRLSDHDYLHRHGALLRKRGESM